jgi:hypothetical protein
MVKGKHVDSHLFLYCTTNMYAKAIWLTAANTNEFLSTTEAIGILEILQV